MKTQTCKLFFIQILFHSLIHEHCTQTLSFLHGVCVIQCSYHQNLNNTHRPTHMHTQMRKHAKPGRNAYKVCCQNSEKRVRVLSILKYFHIFFFFMSPKSGCSLGGDAALSIAREYGISISTIPRGPQSPKTRAKKKQFGGPVFKFHPSDLFMDKRTGTFCV